MVHISFKSRLCFEQDVVRALWGATMLKEVGSLNLLVPDIAVACVVDRCNSLFKLIVDNLFLTCPLARVPLSSIQDGGLVKHSVLS